MTTSTRTRTAHYPPITDFVDFASLEWDGRDYLLCYRFPEELHSVKVLDIELKVKQGIHPETAAQLTAAELLVRICPLPKDWQQPEPRLTLAKRWAQSEILTVVDTSRKE